MIQFFLNTVLANAQAGFLQAKAERMHLNSLTPEKFEREMRLREVRAKERQAAAAEEEASRRGFFVGRTRRR